MSIKQYRQGLILCLPFLLAGCGMQHEKVVAESAQKRWEYMISGELDKAYHYYTDAFKQSMPYKNFRSTVRGTGLWNRAKVEEVTCDEDKQRCYVRVAVTVSMKMRGLPKPLETTDHLTETWVKEGWFSDWRYIKN